jgi:phage-related tail protein
MIFASISVIALIAVVAAKFITAASLQRIRKRAAESDTEIRKVRGSTKAAQNANGVAKRGISTKERKKKALEKQIEKCRKELSELKS